MVVTIKVEKKVDIKQLHVKAGVRYWEDATVDKVEDTEGDLIPCRNGDLWEPMIDIETGIITNWTKGKTAEVHYKVCDQCAWNLKDEAGNDVASKGWDYVPSILAPKGEGYGDYIIMDIDVEGKIADWKCDATDIYDLVENK